MTPAQREIAAKMIEAKGFSLGNLSTDDEVEAAAFVFDQGIFFLPEAARAEVVQMLRKPAEASAS
jgi:hypothetical protein